MNGRVATMQRIIAPFRARPVRYAHMNSSAKRYLPRCSLRLIPPSDFSSKWSGNTHAPHPTRVSSSTTTLVPRPTSPCLRHPFFCQDIMLDSPPPIVASIGLTNEKRPPLSLLSTITTVSTTSENNRSSSSSMILLIVSYYR